MDIHDLVDVNYTFKMKWIKQYLNAPDSFQYFVFENIFPKMRDLEFFLQCNYNEPKLPLKLSNFHLQVLIQPNYVLPTFSLRIKP